MELQVGGCLVSEVASSGLVTVPPVAPIACSADSCRGEDTVQVQKLVLGIFGACLGLLRPVDTISLTVRWISFCPTLVRCETLFFPVLQL